MDDSLPIEIKNELKTVEFVCGPGEEEEFQSGYNERPDNLVAEEIGAERSGGEGSGDQVEIREGGKGKRRSE